jgi:hypothetical protein
MLARERNERTRIAKIAEAAQKDLTLRVPYSDFAGGEGSVAVVHLSQTLQGDPWVPLSVTHEAVPDS